MPEKIKFPQGNVFLSGKKRIPFPNLAGMPEKQALFTQKSAFSQAKNNLRRLTKTKTRDKIHVIIGFLPKNERSPRWTSVPAT
ncbi:MAG: hypothetical protein IJU52_08585 [Clostridia bacterium]|nr:hypothetical protein [Clostridia bacterium]